MPKVLQIEEEIYPHEHLWRSSTALLRAMRSSAEDSHHFSLPALLTTFLAFEAFVNFSGFVCRPDLWADEKKNFKGKGLAYKIETLSQSLPTFGWSKSDATYRRIADLERFRDLVAHGKVRRETYTATYKNDGTHVRWSHEWDEFVSEPRILQARHDIQSFSQRLVDSMRKHFDHLHLLSDAFNGPLGSASGEGVG